MGLLSPFDHRLAPLLGARSSVPPSAVPIPPPVLSRPRPGPAPAAADRRANRSTARFVTRALLADESALPGMVARLEAHLEDDVETWSPSFHATSRAELIRSLLASDDSISDIVVDLVDESRSGPTIFVEWSAIGRFANAWFLEDDRLVEPSGAPVGAAGVMTLRFRDRRIAHIRCFYDQLGLLEQMLGGVGQPLRGAHG
jgi:ketosteroid isomerase-like protein